jgi:hypothetical protein
MTANQIIKLRLQNQQLLNSSFTKPEDLVGWLGAVQSQDYAGAKWALASRLKNPVESTIDKAVDDGKILRTHVLRPTWHFVLPEDIRWMLSLTEPRISAYGAKHFRDQGLDKTLLKRSNKIIVKALEQGKHLTKKEIGDLLKKARIDTNDLRLTFIIIRAELDQLVCNGARRGKQFTYALLDQRAPDAKLLKKDEALAEIGKRYFTSRGPATIKDLTWWSGLSPADARKSVEIIKSQLTAESVNGETYYYYPALTVKKSSKSQIHLLPSWDEFTVAYKDRSLAIDPAFEKESGHGIFNPNIVANGQIIGTWKRVLKNNTVDIQTGYFSNPAKTILEKTSATARAYAKFIGKHPTITIVK